jgi:putative transposase
MLIRSERHLRAVLKEYREHYNDERPHRSRDLRPPSSRGESAPHRVGGTIKRSGRLGGLLSHYHAAELAI